MKKNNKGLRVDIFPYRHCRPPFVKVLRRLAEEPVPWRVAHMLATAMATVFRRARRCRPSPAAPAPPLQSSSTGWVGPVRQYSSVKKVRIYEEQTIAHRRSSIFPSYIPWRNSEIIPVKNLTVILFYASVTDINVNPKYCPTPRTSQILAQWACNTYCMARGLPLVNASALTNPLAMTTYNSHDQPVLPHFFRKFYLR